MTRNVIKTSQAPAAIGPYSVAIQIDGLLFTSGQTALDPVSGELVQGGVEAQTRQVLTNIRHVLEAGNSSLNLVLKTTVFLKDMADFSKMNAVYAEFFPTEPPARSTVAVAGLPKGGLVEIETIALLKS